jgi:hypothetical protein
MMFPGVPIRCSLCWLFLGFLAGISVFAGYKIQPYKPLPIENYPSRLTSEGLAVAVNPMFADAAIQTVGAARRGNNAMPLPSLCFNPFMPG